MKQFSRVLSHEQHWGDKIYKLKRPFIKSKTTGTYIFQAVYNAQSTCLKLIKHLWFFQCLFQCRHLLHESRPITEVIAWKECLKQTEVRFQWGIPAKRIRKISKLNKETHWDSASKHQFSPTASVEPLDPDLNQMALLKVQPLILSVSILTEKVPLSYTFYWQIVPLSHTLLKSNFAPLLTSVNALSLKCEWITKPEHFLLLFTAIKEYRLDLLGFFKDRPSSRILQPFHILQQVNSKPFHVPEG